jgi:hypothetical protein
MSEFDFTDSDPLPTVVDDPVLDLNADSGFTQVGGDTARFLRHDFPKPYLAVPGGARFTWPVGVEGFEITEDAEVASHKYLGGLDLDVDVTHRGEKTITLSGTFPGWSSTDHMKALQAAFVAPQPANGKALSLPFIFPTAIFVVCISLRHAHDESDRTQDIQYSLTMKKIGSSAALSDRGLASSGGSSGPDAGSNVSPSDQGAQSWMITNSALNTLRKVVTATQVGSDVTWETIYNIPENKAYFDSKNIPSMSVPDYQIPPGTKIFLP